MTARRAALLLSLAMGASACAGDDLAGARDRGVAWLESHVVRPDPQWAGLFGYLHRRFGLTVRLASGGTLHEPEASPVRPELAAIYRRLDDPRARATREEIAALDTAVDRIVASALHCDRIGLPPDWPDVLREAARRGGYALTHSVLAAEWTIENDCLPWEALSSVHSEQMRRLELLVATRDDLAERSPQSTDLWIEALAMLYYAGAGSRVHPEWVRGVVEAQRADGGWPLHPEAPHSHPHPTALALWVLLENLQPEAEPIRWIPRG